MMGVLCTICGAFVYFTSDFPFVYRYMDVEVENCSVAFPVIDITQNAHDTLFSKLFYSWCQPDCF